MDNAIHHCNSLYTIVNTNQFFLYHSCEEDERQRNGTNKRLTMGNAFEAVEEFVLLFCLPVFGRLLVV